MPNDDELSRLPLKSLELGSKTVAKLKPLGVKTAGDLFLHRPEALVALGLVEKELRDIAEGASMFGAKWATEDEVRALFASSAPKVVPAPKPKPAPAAVPKSSPALTLPIVTRLGPEIEALYARDAGAPITPPLSAKEVRAFVAAHLRNDSYRDTVPPDPRWFGLFRRLRTIEAKSIDAGEKLYAEALIDATQLPRDLTGEERTAFAVAMSCDFAHLLKMNGVETTGGRVLSAFHLNHVLRRKSAPRVERLVARHRAWVGASRLLLGAPQPFDVGGAARALHEFGEDGDAFAILRAQPLDPDALGVNFDANLRDVATVFREAGKHAEGVAALGSVLGPSVLARVTLPWALHEAAGLLARTGHEERAVLALTRARQVGYDLASAIEEPDFVPLKGLASFRRLFAGHPVFAKRLFG